MVILLSNGFRQARFQNVSMIDPAPLPPEISDFGSPERFVPQKTKAKRKAVLLAATGTLMALAAALYLAMAW